MDFPFLLLALLALPLAVGAVIVLVSAARHRGHAVTEPRGAEPTHRLQADTAAVQDAAVRRATVARKVRSGRERRAGSAAGPTEG